MNNSPQIDELLYDALILKTQQKSALGHQSHYTFYFAEKDKADLFANEFNDKKFEIRPASDGGFRVEAQNLYDISFSQEIDQILQPKKHLRVFSDYNELSVHQKIRTNAKLRNLLPHAVVYEQLPQAKGREKLEYFLYFSDIAKRDSCYQTLRNLTGLSKDALECRIDRTHVTDKEYYTIYIRNQTLANAIEGVIPRNQIIPVIGRRGGVNLGAHLMSADAAETLDRILGEPSRAQGGRA